MKKILLVEDNDTASKVTKLNIERLGFICDVAPDGETALDMFSRNYYSMVLMDLDLGDGINGYETTQNIRQIEAKYRRDKTPVIALTAQDKRTAYEACLNCGMEDILQKPLNPYRDFINTRSTQPSTLH